MNRMIARAGVETAARASRAECATPTTASNAAKMDMGVPLRSEKENGRGRRRQASRRGTPDGARGRGRPAASGSSRRGSVVGGDGARRAGTRPARTGAQAAEAGRGRRRPAGGRDHGQAEDQVRRRRRRAQQQRRAPRTPCGSALTAQVKHSFPCVARPGTARAWKQRPARPRSPRRWPRRPSRRICSRSASKRSTCWSTRSSRTRVEAVEEVFDQAAGRHPGLGAARVHAQPDRGGQPAAAGAARRCTSR